MTARQTAIVAAARACIGARFRLHGRDPAHGLDCVGLAAIAYGLAAPSGYALRGGRAADVLATLDALGFRPAGALAAGDLLLLAPGPFQLHLAVTTPAGFVHADAGLRHVVETPGMPRFPAIARLRPPQEIR